MSSGLGTVRENIEAQGFCGLDDKTCTQINLSVATVAGNLHAVGGRGNGACLANDSVGLGALCCTGRNSARAPV